MKIRNRTQTLLFREDELPKIRDELSKLEKLSPPNLKELSEGNGLTTVPPQKILDGFLQVLGTLKVGITGEFGSSFNTQRNIKNIISMRKKTIALTELQRIIFDCMRFSKQNCYYAYEQTAQEETTRVAPVIVYIDRGIHRVLRIQDQETDPRKNYLEIFDDNVLRAVEMTFEAKAIVKEALERQVGIVDEENDPRITKQVESELFRMQMRQAGRLIAGANKIWTFAQRRKDSDRYEVPPGEILGINRIIEHVEAPHLINMEVFSEIVCEQFEKSEARRIVKMARELFERSSKEPIDPKIELN